jgi:hypothetical protein
MLALTVLVLSALACGEGATALPGDDDAGPSLAGVEIDVHQAPG